MGSNHHNRIEKEDSLDMENIRQLHNATLALSNQSFEIKKLCVTLYIAFLTFSLTLSTKFSTSKEFIDFFVLIGTCICLTFYMADCMTYYYQKSLRNVMNKTTLQIKVRNNINVPPRSSNNKIKLFLKSLFNGSQLIYLGLLLITLLIAYIYPIV